MQRLTDQPVLRFALELARGPFGRVRIPSALWTHWGTGSSSPDALQPDPVLLAQSLDPGLSPSELGPQALVARAAFDELIDHLEGLGAWLDQGLLQPGDLRPWAPVLMSLSNPWFLASRTPEPHASRGSDALAIGAYLEAHDRERTLYLLRTTAGL